MKKQHIIFLIIAFIISISGKAQDQFIQRIEPPHWWVRMVNPELQIMLYGDKIGELEARVLSSEIKLLRTETTSNPNYLFVYVFIPGTYNKKDFDIDFYRNEKIVANIKYELQNRISNSRQRQGFNPSDVIYLIMPDRFANGNTENDIVESMGDTLNRLNNQDRHGGDLEGIIEHLDYLEKMGFTALWLNPVLSNKMPRTSYHGYATTDYYEIDPRYGNLDDYKKLSQEARKRGIKLIMDQIMNHCGLGHWWVKDPPDTNWFNNKEKYGITNHRRTVLTDPHAALSDYEKFERGWFVDQMPDLNGSHPLFSDYLIQNSIWWIEEANLVGIRHDTHPYADLNFINKWTCSIMNEYPNFNIVGEEWSPNPIITSRWQAIDHNQPNELGSCLPSLMDFPLQETFTKSLIQDENWNSGLNNLYELLGVDYVYNDPYNLVIFPDNHDMDRFFTQINEDFNLFKMGIAFILTTRGIPQIYYGTEILMANPESHDHGDIRKDFPGGWKSDKINAFNGIGLNDKQRDAQEYMRKILNWRKSSEAIHSGKLLHYAPQNGIYVYFRYTNDEKVMVVLNKGQKDKFINIFDYPEMLNEKDSLLDIINEKKVESTNFIIPSKTTLIFEIIK